MQWFYSEANERRGPVSTEDLRALIARGGLASDALVWREGFQGWVPWQSVEAQISGNSAPVTGDSARCMECGSVFGKADLIEFQGQWVCAGCKPRFLLKIKQGQAPGKRIWRKRKELVIAKDATLPGTCIKCNAPANDVLKRQLYWHHPALYILIVFPGLLFYVIFAMVLRKRANFEVGMCPRHRTRRVMLILAHWVAFFAGFGLLFLVDLNKTGGITLMVTALLMMGGAIISGVIIGRVIYASKIDDEYAYVRGACAEYLEQFPEWQG